MTKPKRRKGKPLAKLSQVTIDTIALAQAMEIADDLVLLKMRVAQLVEMLKGRAE